MKRLFNSCSLSPVIKNAKRMPSSGSYYALIAGAETRVIKPCFEDLNHCLIVRYILVHTETHDVFDIEESYSVLKDNPRTQDFVAFLNHHGCDFSSEDDMIGLTAVVEVANELLGGYIHPTISFRPWALSRAIQGYADETRPI